MADVVFRPATADDAADIKALIRLVRINPMDLDWRRFLLASSPDGMLAACAQVKPHADGTLELASLAVGPAWRGRGLARRLRRRTIPWMVVLLLPTLGTFLAGGAAIIRTHSVVAGLQTARVADAIVRAMPASEL